MTRDLTGSIISFTYFFFLTFVNILILLKKIFASQNGNEVLNNSSVVQNRKTE